MKKKRRSIRGLSAEGIHAGLCKVAVLSVLFFSITPLLAAPPRLYVDGNKIKDPNGNNVVLRGVSMIDVGAVEEWYGGAINLVDRLTNQDDTNGNSPGWFTKVIRIPVYPQDSPDFNSPFKFNPDNNDFYDNLLRPVVDYCAEKNVYAVIDWHYITNTYDKVDQTSEFWAYMAQRFADDNHVIFELFNEPVNTGGSDTDNWLSVRDDMQTWIDIVRTYAPHNLILVGTPRWSQIIAPTADYPVSDNNVIYVAHIYPYHWLSNNSYYTSSVVTAAAAHPVIVGEWGFISDAGAGILNGTAGNYGEPLKEFLEENRISNIAWAAHYDWDPHMFDPNWQLLCGDGYMGCFAKDWLYEASGVEQTVDLTITKCKVTAGKVQGQDAFDASGTFASSLLGLYRVTQIDVNIVSLEDESIIYQESIDFNSSQVVNNKYKYSYKIPKGGEGAITSLTIDFSKKTFALKSKNIDLTGLGCPLRLDMTLSNYLLTGEADEAIVNSKKSIPTRLMRTYKDTLIVTKAKAKNSTSALADTFSVSGGIAVDGDVEDSNLADQDVNIVWGGQTFTIPAGSLVAAKMGNSYKCSKVTVSGEFGQVTAKFDLDKCTFTVSMKGANLDVTSGDVVFGINFTDFNETADLTLP